MAIKEVFAANFLILQQRLTSYPFGAHVTSYFQVRDSLKVSPIQLAVNSFLNLGQVVEGSRSIANVEVSHFLPFNISKFCRVHEVAIYQTFPVGHSLKKVEYDPIIQNLELQQLVEAEVAKAVKSVINFTQTISCNRVINVSVSHTLDFLQE